MNILCSCVQAVFQITPLTVEEWAAVLKLSFPVILIDEVLKLIARKFTDGKCCPNYGHLHTSQFITLCYCRPILFSWSSVILERIFCLKYTKTETSNLKKPQKVTLR